MDKVLIHIGYQKTGSTWLQKTLFKRGDKVFEPINERDSGASNLARHFFKDPEGNLLSPFDENLKNIKDSLKWHLDNNPIPEGKIPVLSNERLAGNAHAAGFDAAQVASRLRSTFPNGKVLITIRDQRSIILSIYFLYLSRGGTMSLKRYLNSRYDGKRPHFSPNHINYLPLTRHYSKLFGKHNVKVIPLELLETNSNEFLSEIGQFVGRKLAFDQINLDEKINKTSNHFINYHFRVANHFLWSNSLNNYSSLNNRYMGKAVSLMAKAAAFFIPPRLDELRKRKMEIEINQWVADRYKVCNQELSQEIGLDLSLFGY
ncbi:MAG: sulfotransferase domain-containing protein [Cytophagales bacterium]|nr:sulfotransferase domain-containing protein [Cytophagales bacterium]